MMSLQCGKRIKYRYMGWKLSGWRHVCVFKCAKVGYRQSFITLFLKLQSKPNNFLNF